MDLIASHQASVVNAVAVSGTALTAFHLNLIKRLTDNLVMAFDGDTAGISAARRGINIALSLGMEVKIALLPDGLDPADLVAQDGGGNWHRAVAEATNVIDFYLASLARKNFDSRTLNRKIVEEVLPYVARLSNIIDQAHFVSKIASFVGTKEDPVWEELKKVKLEPEENLTLGNDKETSGGGKETALADARLTMILEQLFGLNYWLASKSITISVDLPEKILTILGPDRFAKEQARMETIKDQLSLQAELSFEGNEFIEEEVKDLLCHLEDELLRLEQSDLLRQVQAGERDGQAQAELLGRVQTIAVKREALKKEIRN